MSIFEYKLPSLKDKIRAEEVARQADLDTETVETVDEKGDKKVTKKRRLSK